MSESTWPSFFRYWGKARRQEDQPGDEVHLLPYHCLDVAACGYWLIKSGRFHGSEIFARLGLSGEDAARWFAFFLAMHDVGKFARGFQQLGPESPPLVPAIAGKIYDASQGRHDALGFWLWKKVLREQSQTDTWHLFPESTLSRSELYSLDSWLEIVTGHHGKPPHMPDGWLSFHDEDVVAAREWLQALGPLLGLDYLPACFADKQWRKGELQPASWPLAGLTVLADWLGSDACIFSHCATPMPLAEYWEQTLSRAQQAVAHLPEFSPVEPFQSIGSLFPFIQHPTPLQQLAQQIELSGPGPELFILEDVTGAGKTEAAMILVHRLLTAGKGDGLYVGLPTMATANAMFGRLQRAYRRLYASDTKPSLMLAHGARQLNEAFTQSVWSDGDNVGQASYVDGDMSASAACNGWLADSRKKALLAEVGVGTLDQALMAILPFRHQSLRMLGLQGKVLVLDEVHAYDAYMGKLLETLLIYHASQGGSAIILSATLSQTQRERLVDAFAKGAHRESAALAAEPDYPLLTYYGTGFFKELPVATRPEVRRRVAIAWRHDEAACLEQIRLAVQAGHCIAWIRNSVDDAIRSYCELEKQAWMANEDLLLFHSRFAFADRLGIEAKTLAWFGKDSTASDRQGKVIISTQVIEQSMDLDLDEMISDLAPIDLLVQRAGRLQRHVRDAAGNPRDDGQDQRPDPCLMVYAPEWTDAPDSRWLSSALRNTGYVYPDHGQLWLSQQVLRQEGEIRMPEAARRLVESVYGEAAAVPAGLVARSDSEAGKRLSERASAMQVVLNPEHGYSIQSSDRWLEDIELSTRLGDPSTTLYLAYRQQEKVVPYAAAPFAWEMSRLQVREALWLKLKAQIPHLQGGELQRQREVNHLAGGEVILLPQGECGFYSARFGFQLQEES